MAEGNVATCPQVFVVDTRSNYVSMPKETLRARLGQKLLLLLVGLTTLGLVVQGYFIYTLYKKTEAFSLGGSHPFYLNQSDPRTSALQVDKSLLYRMCISGCCLTCVAFFSLFLLFQGGTMSQVGSKGRQNPEQIQHRPFAHLMGSNSPVGVNNVVQWIDKSGDAITHNMSYDKGQLLVEKEGFYYLYSKVQLNAAVECSLILHKVMKNTTAYGQPIELMRSKSFRCRTPKPPSAKASAGEDLWNSFLAGIFHLQSGDKIFVTLENIQKIRPGPADNFMGAFMIMP
uniref:THD domain-containing protein n=1 Tax=Scophthalmus maximus TaxID=52904 RepID=A0A8D3BYB5_SCOMX